jgi:hypothetical protein
MTRIRDAGLAVVISAALAIVTAGAAFAAPTASPPRHTLNLHRVNWGNVAIPGRLCRVKGLIRLDKGQAKIGDSGYGPLDVVTFGPTYGNLGGGQEVAALQVWCDNQGGTAAGQIAEGLMVFSGAGGRLHVLGTLTPQYRPRPAGHIPYIVVKSIGAERIVSTEYWYAATDEDCCPTGRATTTWYWYDHSFHPGRTMVR